MASSPAASSTTTSPRRPRWGRRILAVLVVLVLVVGVLVALAPTIASSLAPGIAASAITDSINGKATVAKTSLSWGGRQEIGPVEVTDAQGQRVATLTITADRGLWSLLKAGVVGPLDVGQVRVAGTASLIRRPDGTLNVATLVKPRTPAPGQPTPPGGGGAPPPKPAEPVKLPPGLRAELVLDDLEITFVDQQKTPAGTPPVVGAVRIPKLAGVAGISGGEVKADINAAILYGPGTTATTPGGTLAIKATTTNLTDAAGVLTLDKAVVDASVDLADLAVAAADALAGTGTGLVEALGQTLGASIALKGNAGQADATVRVASRGLNADLALVASSGVLSASRPGTIELKTSGARQLLKLDQALAGQDRVTVAALPDVRVNLADLRLTLPMDPKDLSPRPLDLRGSRVALAIETTETAGTVRVPGPDGALGPPRDYRVAPLSMRLESPDLADRVTLKGGTSATLGGQPAGQLIVDVLAEGPLDDKGRPRPTGPQSVRGQVTLAQLATAIAQPLVEAAGIDLARGVGPTLDLALTAQTDPSKAAGGAVPPTSIDLVIKSQGVNASAALALDAAALRTRDDRTRVTIASIDALLGRALRNAGFELTQPGAVDVALASLAVPLNDQRQPVIDQAEINATATLSRLALRPVPQPALGQPQPAADPIAIDSLAIAATSAKGAPPRFTVNGAGAHERNPFTIAGGFDLVGLRPILAGKQPPHSLRPVGELRIENLPTTLLGMFMAPAPAAAPPASQPTSQPTSQPAPRPPLDVARLVRDALGPSLNVVLTSATKQSGQAEGVDVALTTTARNLNGQLKASLDTQAIALSVLDFRTTLTPELAATLLDSLGPALQSRPTLAGPAALTLTAAPLTIPFKPAQPPTFEPDFARAGDADLKLQIAGTTMINSIVVKDDQGQPRDIGPLGLQDVLVSALVPLRALAPGSAALPAKAVVTAGILGDPTTRIVDLSAQAQVALAAGKPQGDLNAGVDLNIADTVRLDTLLAKPNLLRGSAGETLRVKADAVVTFPPAGAAPAAGAAAPPFTRAVVNASIAAPRLKTTQPLRATATPDRLALDQPLTLSWQPGPGFLNAYVLGLADRPVPNAPPEPARFAAPADLTVTVNALRLALPQSDAEGPLKQGVFTADARIVAPQASMVISGTPAAVRGLDIAVTAGNTPGQADARIQVADMGQGPADGGAPAVDIRAQVVNAYNPAGQPTPDAAQLNITGRAEKISTALVDAIAKQNGVIVEALGPTAAMTINARGLSKNAGTLDVTANSPRAQAAVKGRIEQGTFITEGAPEVRLLEITPGLSAAFVKGLPQLASIEKTLQDGPGIIRAQGLTVPLDGNLAKLNGDVSLDLGTISFTTTEIFGKLLKAGGGRAAGVAGRRLEPFNVALRQGVATYERFTLPLGEFALSTRGTVDLVNKQLDVITYIPFGAVTDETARLFKAGGVGEVLGGVFQQSAQLPFRTAGSFERPETRPDLKLFAQEAAQNLTDKPKELLKDPGKLGETIKDLFKKKEEKQ